MRDLQTWRQTAHKIYKDNFLYVREKPKKPLTIFLVNGVKLQGMYTWFDNFCLMLRRGTVIRSCLKTAILSTIMTGAPIKLFEGGTRILRHG